GSIHSPGVFSLSKFQTKIIVQSPRPGIYDYLKMSSFTVSGVINDVNTTACASFPYSGPYYGVRVVSGGGGFCASGSCGPFVNTPNKLGTGSTQTVSIPNASAPGIGLYSVVLSTACRNDTLLMGGDLVYLNNGDSSVYFCDKTISGNLTGVPTDWKTVDGKSYNTMSCSAALDEMKKWWDANPQAAIPTPQGSSPSVVYQEENWKPGAMDWALNPIGMAMQQFGSALEGISVQSLDVRLPIVRPYPPSIALAEEFKDIKDGLPARTKLYPNDVNPYLVIIEIPTMGGLNLSAPAGIYRVWDIIRDMVNYLFILALIIIGYLVMFRVKVNQYAMKLILPRFILGAIAVQYSWMICQVVVDLFTVLGLVFMNMFNQMSHTAGAQANLFNGWSDITAVLNYCLGFGIAGQVPAIGNWGSKLPFIGGFAKMCTGLGAQIGKWIVIMILFFLAGVIVFLCVIVVRGLAIYALVAVSPVVFLLWIFPDTAKAFKQWGSALLGLLIVYPLALLVFIFCTLIAQSLGS
ncbi:MAG: hypothetical protein WCP97_09310, partial [bacterium]